MRSDRLVVLVAPEEKARLVALARARGSSVGELVREGIASLDAPRTGKRTGAAELASKLIALGCKKVRDNEDGSHLWRSAEGTDFLVVPGPKDKRDLERFSPSRAAAPEAPMVPADQAAALERLADVALEIMQKANAALDEAFEEVEATKAYFAAKRSKAGARA